ncbi:MAG: hypothetical protein WDW38_010413 [Sanguina aurantia]
MSESIRNGSSPYPVGAAGRAAREPQTGNSLSRAPSSGIPALGKPQRRRGLVVSNSGAAGGMAHGSGGRGAKVNTAFSRTLVGLAVFYIAIVVLLPFFNVFVQVKMTLLLAVVAVPINSIFGTIAAINITRNDFPGKVLLLSILDLPFSISPVVTGLMLTLLFGRTGWFAAVLRDTGFNVVFAFTGMLLATMFVTLPFVVRELIPILETMDLSQEEAARTLGASDAQVFWHVTLPNIRWGLLYGVILTNARAMGEFGAVSVISGNIIGKTQTMTLFVESSYKEYCSEAAFAAALLLSLLALITLGIKDKVEQAAAAEASK